MESEAGRVAIYNKNKHSDTLEHTDLNVKLAIVNFK